VQPAEHFFVRAVKVRSLLPGLMQLLHALLRSTLKIADRAKLDRLRRASFRAGRLQATLHPIITERALLGGTWHRVGFDDAETASSDAVSAAITGVRLNDDRIELGPYNRARRTNLQARCLDAMLAHIAHQEPAAVLPVLSELLDELHMTPVNAVEPARVVVAVAAQCVHAAVGARELIPFLAGDLARFAADADGRVGIKSHGFSHLNSPFLAYPHLVTVLVARRTRNRSRTRSPLTPSPHCRRTLFLRASKRSDRL